MGADGDANRLPNMVKDHRPSRLNDRLDLRGECVSRGWDAPLALSVKKLFSIVDNLLHRRFFVDDMF